MKTSIDEIKGIILSINEYKEYDSIVKMVTENKIIDFIAKGVLKEKWQPIRLLGTDEIQI